MIARDVRLVETENNIMPSRSKRRRIHDNVEKALLAIAQDSTHSATPTDVTGYVDGMGGVWF